MHDANPHAGVRAKIVRGVNAESLSLQWTESFSRNSENLFQSVSIAAGAAGSSCIYGRGMRFLPTL
jgi:hypothetical protein